MTLLGTYNAELARIQEKSHNSRVLPGQALTYAGAQWKVNVVLSTNYAARVLRPEVHLEIQTAENVKVRMAIGIEKFEELRR